MFSHVMLGAKDVGASKAFYDALFAALGGKSGRTDDKGRVMWAHDGSLFMISAPIDGGEACHANGGTTCEDPPGYREASFGKLYLAYLRDPAGNKLCGLFRPAQ